MLIVEMTFRNVKLELIIIRISNDRTHGYTPAEEITVRCNAVHFANELLKEIAKHYKYV